MRLWYGSNTEPRPCGSRPFISNAFYYSTFQDIANGGSGGAVALHFGLTYPLPGTSSKQGLWHYNPTTFRFRFPLIRVALTTPPPPPPPPHQTL